MRNTLLLIFGLIITEVSFADERTPARILVNQSGQGVAVKAASRSDIYGPRFVASYEDKSVWYFGEKFSEEKYKDAKIDVLLHYYFCTLKSGKIKLNEHEDLAWIKKESFNKYEFAEGDKNIVSLL